MVGVVEGHCGDEKGVGAERSESETRLSVSLLAVGDARPLVLPLKRSPV